MGIRAKTSLLSTLLLSAFLLPGANAAPAITGVVNNYSYTQPGFPNSGVSPSTLIIITGTGLANPTAGPVTLQSSASPGLPTTLNGAAVQVSVGAVTVTPGLYYALPTALAAVLPASTPTGSASVSVSVNGGAPSPAFQFQVVPTAPGLDTYYGTSGGMVTATDNVTGALITFTNSAAPLETIVLWGSGLGADTADSDTVFTSSPHPVNQSSTEVYIGGVAATVLYAGSSGYPGLNQIDVTIPANVPVGCRVSIVAVVAGVDSNFALMPINPGGGVCSDPIYGYDGNQLTASLTSTVTSGIAQIQQLLNSPLAGVTFVSDVDGNAYTALGPLSLEGCTVMQGSGPTQYGGTLTYLSAGTVSLQGPGGTYALTSTTGTTPDSAVLPTGAIPASGGTFVFTATGSAQVGPFTVTINMSPLMTWTNSSDAKTVSRAQGLQINWSGGQPSSYIQIIGQSVVTGPPIISAQFQCFVPQSAGTFTVPPYVLSALPAGSGNVDVENFTGNVPFMVTGVDEPYFQAGNSISVTSKYQ
ncbi:MAG: hypothetical protein ABSH00_13715 [Bryobacteraceae bacterium]|jgi:uncharacterized protein (TIGR03437 family)